MTLVITDGEFWWSWRELNPRMDDFNLLFFKSIFKFMPFGCMKRAYMKSYLSP